MDLKFKKLSEKAVMPVRAHNGDAGLDLTCTNITTALNEAGQLMIVYHTDLAVEIPEGYVGFLMPRSSIWKKSIMLTNHVGVIDSSYRGEIIAVFRATTDVVPKVYNQGDRFAQLVIVPIPEFEPIEAEELSETDRGDDGFGSTGDNDSSAATGSQSHPDSEGEPISSETANEPAAGNEDVPEQS